MYQVCITHDNLIAGHDFHVVTLKHPKTEESAQFAFSQDYTQLHEVLRHKPEFGSWFIGDEISSDGAVLYITQCDPVFLVLPYLIKQSKSNPERYSPLEQVLEDDIYPNTRKLCRCHALSALDNITDYKGADDYKAYKYNEEKTLKWLNEKVNRLTSHLEKSSIHVGSSGAQSSTFIRSNNDTDISSDEYRVYSFNIVSDYIPEELKESLRSHLGLPKDVKVVKEEPPNKKAKTTNGGPLEDYSKGILSEKQNADKKPPTALEKKLKKIDTTGMKSITSFFSVKPKKTS